MEMTATEKIQSRFTEIAQHYANACEKHPHFADVMDKPIVLNYAAVMKNIRDGRHDRGKCTPKIILDAEYAEIIVAYDNGDIEHAIYETYDCSAVLMRLLDNLEAQKEARK